MATRTARIKSHTRTSKNGKVHKVKAHGRAVSMSEMLQSVMRNPSLKKVKWAAIGSVGLTGAVYVLSTAMSVAASLVWAILLGCMAVMAMLLMTKGQRKAKRKKFREAAALSVERRLKLWTHHQVVKYRKPVPAAKAKPKPKGAPRPQSASEGVTHTTPSEGEFIPPPAMRDPLAPRKTAAQLRPCAPCKGTGVLTKKGHIAGHGVHLGAGDAAVTHYQCRACFGQGKA